MRLVRLPNSPKWYVYFRDHESKRHTIAAFLDPHQSQRFAEQVEHLVALRSAGEPLDVPAIRWLKRLPERRRAQLAKIGLLSEGAKPINLAAELERYEQALIDKGVTPADAREAAARCRRTISSLGTKLVDELTPTAVQGYLAGRRRQGMSATTSNHYLKQLKAFANWLVREKRAKSNPLVSATKVTEVKDTQRAFSQAELERLLEVTCCGPVRFGMTGLERYWLYRFAAETGLRAGEIRRLRPSDFDWDTAAVLIRPKAGRLRPKARGLVRQPLRVDTARELKTFLVNPLANPPRSPPENPENAFKVPKRSAAMLAEDLADAGIPREDADGRVLVFHSLRHTFGTNLVLAGIDLATIQRLMRHASIQMTIDRYGHVPPEAAQAAVERLGALSMPAVTDPTPETASGA